MNTKPSGLKGENNVCVCVYTFFNSTKCSKSITGKAPTFPRGHVYQGFLLKVSHMGLTLKLPAPV